MKPFVSSYALASSAVPWRREDEDALFSGLAELDLSGVEIPFDGVLHRAAEDWLISRLDARWRVLVTLLPATMSRLKSDPHFGLASRDTGGRERALELAAGASRALSKLRSRAAAVVVHSAPRLGGEARSSLEAFADSLSKLRALDWNGAEILVEHCDAWSAERECDKGFLRLEDECAAARLSSGKTPVRVLLNWGRSALEARSAEGPLTHARRAREAGLLAGMFFSGVCAEDELYGAWRDSHAPFAASRPASVLTRAAAAAALKEAGSVDYLGLKIQPLPASATTGERLALLRTSLGELSAALA